MPPSAFFHHPLRFAQQGAVSSRCQAPSRPAVPGARSANVKGWPDGCGTPRQLEFGCRGGTDTPWWTGSDRESLRGKVNIADQSARSASASWGDINDWPDLDDGWAVHAPVGSLPANGYGLHEVHGNVWEWCRDGSANFSAADQVDPLTPYRATNPCIFRGGSFTESAARTRSASRFSRLPESKSFNLGLRPARTITP